MRVLYNAEAFRVITLKVCTPELQTPWVPNPTSSPHGPGALIWDWVSQEYSAEG